MNPPAASTLSRHLRWETFDERIRRGHSSMEPIKGSPMAVLFVAPGGSRIGIRISTPSATYVASPLAEISILAIGLGKGTALEISTGNAALFRDFYSLCCTLADRVQLEGLPVESALKSTISSWAKLIRERTVLSEARQVGLFGELLFLQKTAATLGWRQALQCWQGPGSEEHDFTLPKVDVEVKSTTRENRVHRISSLTQLMPKEARKLFLVSVQLTVGVGRGSQTLPELVSAVLSSAIGAGPETAERMRERLEQQDWDDADIPRYGNSYLCRAPLVAIAVDHGCPAIVPGSLETLPPASRARIEDVSYSINVDGLGVASTKKQFKRLLFPGGQP